MPVRVPGSFYHANRLINGLISSMMSVSGVPSTIEGNEVDSSELDNLEHEDDATKKLRAAPFVPSYKPLFMLSSASIRFPTDEYILARYV